MNPIREAAVAIHDAESKHPGLAISMAVSHKYVHFTADMRGLQYSRSVTWTEIETANINVLTATVALLTNKIAAAADAA